MHVLDLTLDSAASNVALDEALLLEAEDQPSCGECLRLWEPESNLVVVGRGTNVEDEVQVQTCQQDRVPIIRRTSGGATICSGPGCLMYALVLSIERHPELKSVSSAYRYLLPKMAHAVGSVVRGVAYAGISDLVIRGQTDRKFSGNSLRFRRRYVLCHGTILNDFPLEVMSRWLKHPPREPAYRGQRPHGEFVANLNISTPALKQALIACWEAVTPWNTWPQERTRQLVTAKYERPEWNLRH